MHSLQEYVGSAWRLDRDGFGRAFPHPFLLLQVSRQAEDDGSSDWRFKTDTVITSDRFPAGLRAEGVTLSEEAKRYRVVPVVKGGANPWRERISVGRAGNNDIVLPDGSVSKLHAHFVAGDEGLMYLVDVGSRNGTAINDKRLSKGDQARVGSGDIVCLGRVRLTYLDAVGFYDFLKEQLQ